MTAAADCCQTGIGSAALMVSTIRMAGDRQDLPRTAEKFAVPTTETPLLAGTSGIRRTPALLAGLALLQ